MAPGVVPGQGLEGVWIRVFECSNGNGAVGAGPGNWVLLGACASELHTANPTDHKAPRQLTLEGLRGGEGVAGARRAHELKALRQRQEACALPLR